MGNLVLTRRKKESIKVVIEGKVVAEITLLGTSRSDARMAFEAEKHVKFYRSEVWERMQKEGAK
jgi:carbon storage regulator CsrA